MIPRIIVIVLAFAFHAFATLTAVAMDPTDPFAGPVPALSADELDAFARKELAENPGLYQQSAPESTDVSDPAGSGQPAQSDQKNPWLGRPTTDNLKACAYYNRGIIKMEAKKYLSAMLDFRQAIQHDPTFAPAHVQAGHVWQLLGRTVRALEHFNKAINLDPTLSDAYAMRGFLQIKLKNFAKAISDFDEAIRLDPTSATTFDNRGYCKLRVSDYSGAMDDFNEAIRLDPEFANAYAHRAGLWDFLGDAAKATADFDKAIALADKQRTRPRPPVVQPPRPKTPEKAPVELTPEEKEAGHHVPDISFDADQHTTGSTLLLHYPNRYGGPRE